MSSELPSPSVRPRVVLTVCVAAVLVASFFSRRAGACGTAHYLFFRLMGGLVAELIVDFSGVELGTLIEKPLAILFNVGVFVLLIRFWKRRAPARWHLIGLVALTVLYLASYFYFFPTRDCP
jgi:hypothetical protein